MMRYTDLKVGDSLNWINDDFDCVRDYKIPCTVAEVFDDHVVAVANDIRLWIDDDTIVMFERR